MIPSLLAALLATGAPADTVHTVDGGRVVGIVLEERPSSGVTIRTPDGAVRRFAPGQVARVEYSDGTVSPPRAAGSAPEVRPATPSLARTAARLDTAHLAGGGRVRCLVVEEGPDGVVARLVDGAERRFPPGQVSRIDWADGTSSELQVPPPADGPGQVRPPTGAGAQGGALRRAPSPPPPRVLRPLPPSSQ